jgi:hypothetical protein
LTEQAIEPAVLAWTRLLRAYVSTTRLLSAELQEAHGLTILGKLPGVAEGDDSCSPG